MNNYTHASHRSLYLLFNYTYAFDKAQAFNTNSKYNLLQECVSANPLVVRGLITFDCIVMSIGLHNILDNTPKIISNNDQYSNKALKIISYISANLLSVIFVVAFVNSFVKKITGFDDFKFFTLDGAMKLVDYFDDNEIDKMLHNSTSLQMLHANHCQIPDDMLFSLCDHQ